MKKLILIVPLFLCTTAFADSLERVILHSQSESRTSQISAKPQCAQNLQIAKEDVRKKCSLLDGKIVSMEIYAFPIANPNDFGCRISIQAACETSL